MNKALLDRLQQRIATRSLLDHPFYQAWQAGELSLTDLRVYAGQYYFFEANFPRLLSAIHSRCPDLEMRQSILDNLWDEEHGEDNHRAMWLDFCVSLGLDRGSIEPSPIQSKTQALLDTYTTICAQGSFQEGLAAIYAYEVQVPQVAQEKIRGLRQFYGVDDQQSLRFFQVHSILDQDHSQREVDGICNHTPPAAEPAVEAALQAALDAWWGFLDGVDEQRRAMAESRA